MATLKQSTAYTRMILMVDSSDHVTGKTGLTVTVTLSKAGGAFGAAGGAVTEVSSGWYKIALDTTDTNTLGDLAFHCTSSGADPTDFVDQVTVQLPGDTTMDVNVTKWSGGSVPAPNQTGVPIVDLSYVLGTISPASVGHVAIDWSQISNKTATVDLTNTSIASLDSGVVVSGSVVLSASERNSIADALLDRDMSVGTDSGSPTVRTPRQAFRSLRNKWTVDTTALTVYKEDDSTASWTGVISTTANANPVTSTDPAGP